MEADSRLDVPRVPTPAISSGEGTPLLQKPDQDGLVRRDGGGDDDGDGTGTSFGKEARIITGFAVPLAGMNFMRSIMQASTVFAVGRLGTTELAAANLGLLSANVMGYAILIGLVSALDTLANQASTSASPKLTSIYTMRTYVVCCMAMPFLFVLCFNGRTIFAWVTPYSDEKMRGMAADYMKIISLGLPPLAAYECIRRYLSALGLMVGPTLAYSVATPVACFLVWLLVNGPEPFRIGFLGAPLGVVIAYWVLFLVMFVYAYLKVPRYTWAGVSTAIFHDLGIVFRYGLAGVASTCSEWYAFEAIGFGATYLGETVQASTAIYATTLGICWQIPFSIGIAIAIRVGNLLGQNAPLRAKKAAWTAVYLAAGVVALNAVILLAVRKEFGTLFSNDEDVIRQVSRTMFVLAFIAVFDGMQGVSTGILKGAGQPGLAARINLLSYWTIGLPLGAILTYKTQDLTALWGGLGIAVLCASSLMLVKIAALDWAKKAEEAGSRTAREDTYTRLRRVSSVLEAETEDGRVINERHSHSLDE